MTALLPALAVDLYPVVAVQTRQRVGARHLTGVKVNLYTGDEVEALGVAMAAGADEGAPVECLMVGDSYFTTHAGRQDTRLATAAEQRWGLDLLVAQVTEVRAAMPRWLPSGRMPFLMADLPDGNGDPRRARAAGHRFLDAGADVVKIELPDDAALPLVAELVADGILVVGHLGYAPQCGRLARCGDTVAEAAELFRRARAVRDAGACALVLEMVSEPVNRALSLPDPGALPVYSIFSGRAAYGGQSLNVWDAVFAPPPARRYFPPTGTLHRVRDRDRYTVPVIAEHVAALLRLIADGAFPLSPPSRFTLAEQLALLAVHPWRVAV